MLRYYEQIGLMPQIVVEPIAAPITARPMEILEGAKDRVSLVPGLYFTKIEARLQLG
jgi:hypothetical protein